MILLLFIVGIVIVILLLIRILVVSIRHELSIRASFEDRVSGLDVDASTGKVDFAELADLPPPVQRYFRTVLRDGNPLIKQLRMRQTGVIKINYKTNNWNCFSATQTIAAVGEPAFCWNAKVALPFGLHMRVLDSFYKGVGAGRLVIQSAVCLGGDSNNQFINSASLQRYLAEAPWYPTALLPSNGVTWTAIDDDRAQATLSVADLSVSIEFGFNTNGEIISAFTTSRYRREKNNYQPTAWEGHFSDYQERSGIRIPCYGEVGWHIDGALQLVWEGQIHEMDYSFV